ncbi:MAG TPA: tRNA lysidine(34) synthetase TilS, partial [bacterium]|nr:tRNA lysidine(34) synthetase TilS [bacterium]
MSSTQKQYNPEQAVLEYLSEEQIPPGCSLLIAYSGGPDSSALLQVLYQLSAGLNQKLSCAYLDHGIRKPVDTDRELEFIIRRCRFLDLPLVWKRLEYNSLRTEVRQTGRSLEDLAREKRYLFLFDQAKQLEADYIALGHNEDDQLETQVMRFFQGAGAAGLKGIPVRNGKIIRPLMRCNRQTILHYLDTHDINFLVDSTNENQKFLRNAVRKQLIPLLHELFPGYRKSLRILADKMSSINAFLDRESAERLRWQDYHHGYRIRTKSFLEAAGPLRLRSVYRIIDQLVSKPVQIPYRFLVPLLNDEVIWERRVLLNAYGIRLFRA